MAIDVTSVGLSGTHAFTKTNVNTEEDFIYFKNTGNDIIPTTLVVDSTFIYTAGAGSLSGITDGDLLYVTTENAKKLTFSATSGGAPVNFTDASAGSVKFNKPIVYANKLNIDASTASNQAVKYYTNGAPLTGLTSGNTYFLKNVSISDFAGSQALYDFTTHTFTTGGSTGRTGPAIGSLRTQYLTTGATWVSTYLNQGLFTGYQDWTVPVSGVYEFDVQGAAGGSTSNFAGTAGRGARVKGRVALTKGEIITLIIGQRGEQERNTSGGAGGGGASFVVRKSGNEPLFIAGGGAGEPRSGTGRDAVTSELGGRSTNNSAANFNPGDGGFSTSGYSGGGGGFNTAGGTGTVRERSGFFFQTVQNAQGGASYVDGLSHSQLSSRFGGYGGFGGGAMGDSNVVGQSGGGGGYSGGAGSRSTTRDHSGGGGGSFVTANAINVETSDGQYNGLTQFNGVDVVNLNSYNTGEGSVGVALVSGFTTGNEVYPTALDAENGTNQILIEAAGNSYHSFVPINFDLQNNSIHSPTPHTFTQGAAISYTFNGAAPAGIEENRTYYVNFVDTFTYQITANPDGTNLLDFTAPSAASTGAPDTVSRVIVNIDTDTLTINNHGFQVDQPIQYSVGDGTAIAPLVDQATYYVSDVVDANRIRLKTDLNSPSYINFTAVGTGTSHSFIFKTVNELENTLYIPNHGLVSGQSVRYTANLGTPGNAVISGLGEGQTYFVEKIDDSIIRLCTDQFLQNRVDILDVGAGTHSLVITSLNFTTDTITIPNHGFRTKELVEYDSKGQTEIQGLTSGTPYYVFVVDGNNIRLATTPDNVDEGNYVDLQETPAGVGVHALTSLSETPDGIYDISAIPSVRSFDVNAAGTVANIVKTFNPRSTVDLNIDAFKLESHGFVTGTEVTYSTGSPGTAINGLTNDTHYYVVAINKDYLRLANTREEAESGITLAVGDFGTGVQHSFTTTQINGNVTGGGSVTVEAGSVLVNGTGTAFAKILKVGDNFRLYPPNNTTRAVFAATDVNVELNRLSITAHGFTSGDTVAFDANGGVPPAPLVDQYYYFVRALDDDTITLHNSADDAINGIGAVDFSTTGTGTEFELLKSIPVGPIIRKISAVGSDTQITVDRPYAANYSSVSYSFPTFVYVRPQGYSLHRPFDGGVEMSVGAKTSLGQIVRQTRKYFRYQSGKGIQTSCGINFKPSIDCEAMYKFSDIQIEVKTRRPHGLIDGLFIVMSQAENPDGTLSEVYNGEFQVSVVDLTTFRFNSSQEIVNDRAYGFPQFHVKNWSNGAIRSGMFDFQNGAFFEFDGQKLYAVRRSSTQQIAGTVACLQGSELVFGTNTLFTAQLSVGDYIVMRGQSYRIVEIQSDTRLAIRPEYKGASGIEKEFDPGNGTTGVVRLSDDRFNFIGHGFSNNLPVVYNSIDGEPIGGLINGRTYYVSLIDNNNFKLKASPDTATVVNLSSVGTTSVHSFVPAKSGIIVTKTVDTRVPQENWSIDKCDGTGPTGYNLDISRIQMAYIDYSWYGAGKIRFGFKTNDGQVQYVHEFVHNNVLYESYFRSGNLPGRYEVVTYDNPTYIPSLFHWGTSVMMDGTFDDDNAYLFTANSQTLQVSGTTEKSFSAGAISTSANTITIPSHGFSDGNALQFEGVATSGFRGQNTQNPEVIINRAGAPTSTRLINAGVYYAYAESANSVKLFPPTSGPGSLSITAGQDVSTTSQTATTVTVVTSAAHGLETSDIVRVSGVGRVPEYVGEVIVTNTTTFTYDVPASQSATVPSAPDTGRVDELIDFTTQGNTQYTYFLYPEGALNNTSGPNYQPLLSLRLSPSVSEGLTGKLGDRDVINRMQLRLQEIGVSTNSLVDVKILLNPRLNNLNFQSVDPPSLTQVVEHTSADTVSGGVQVYNFSAQGGAGGVEATTTVDVSTLFELSNSILGGDSIFPDGPDILTIAVSRLTGNDTLSSAKMSWAEAQA